MLCPGGVEYRNRVGVPVFSHDLTVCGILQRERPSACQCDRLDAVFVRVDAVKRTSVTLASMDSDRPQ